MGRTFALALFVASLLFSGCISRGYIHGRTPTDGYNEGYAWGASLLPSKEKPIQPDARVAKMVPEIASYGLQAATVPGWYTCNGWTYTPKGEAAYYVWQRTYTDQVTGELRLTNIPARPQMRSTNGYGQMTYPDPCFHVKDQ